MNSRTAPESIIRQKPRVIFLDGIRGWASLSVLLYHLIFWFLALSTPQLRFGMDRVAAELAEQNYAEAVLVALMRMMTDGHLAVLVFFVLSGYALSVSHINSNNRNLALAATSRYFRLMLTVLLFTLITYALFKGGLFYNRQAATTPEFSLHWLGTFYTFDPSLFKAIKFALYNAFFQYDRVNTWNSSLWTMPIELLGSFLIYGYLGVFRNAAAVNWKFLACIIAVLFVISPMFACFFAGHAIAEIDKHVQDRPWLQGRALQYGLLALFGLTLFGSIFFRHNDRITFVIATSLVLTASLSTPLKAFFSNKVSEFLGEISFPLYLIQIPIICSWSSWLFIVLPEAGYDRVTSNVIILFSTIVLCVIAAVLLLPLERFSMNYSKKIGRLLLTAPALAKQP